MSLPQSLCSWHDWYYPCKPENSNLFILGTWIKNDPLHWLLYVLKTNSLFSDKSWEEHKYIYIIINVKIVYWQHHHLAKPQHHVPIKACKLLNYKVQTRLHQQVQISFVKYTPSNQKAAGWSSSAFYYFTRTFSLVSKPVLILLFALYLLRLYYIIHSISFSPTQILPWRIFFPSF